ncbi:alpha/beta fold hydrolase [Aggregicoccus sp. 17bor-14]|uniref:alpha/beta fold hydrolase n=1 Tax=Myxococcaceae TaxID=31 RepID=UPI00129C360A|nr:MULTISPECIES: alpha/beta hydrolase [Myxococcaceae]MBF5041069.1 alpha/beta fold hydrolase [Simulacricoccus sp. 17bor-14]MRI86855.1 alpha/beta fold hydrolase [Aggregicoccus sp. 17bor-14]
MPTLNVDGVPLHYRDEGRGLPVLLFHAFPLTSGSFAPQVAALGGRYRFLLPDARGFGGSALGEGPTEMSRMARDGLAILDALGLDTAVVGGVSMGGYASMALLREDASRVRALVLVDTQVTADDDAGRARRETQAQDALARGVQSVLENNLPKLITSPVDSRVGREVAALMREGTPGGIAAALRGMGLRHDSKDMLARFAGPALVVVGAEDHVTPLEKARQMADLIGGAQLEVIPAAGHLPNQENPEAFNGVLDAFLSRLLAA